MIAVSIVICTRNRAESLRPTLESVGLGVVPDGWSVELVVVDNGSTDHTSQVVQAFRPFNKIAVRYVFEEKRGLSCARNRGLAESGGKVILFTDDDMRVPQMWIKGMCQPILDGEADALAGSISLAPHVLDAVGHDSRYFMILASERFDAVRSVQWLTGANMAFGRDVLRMVPRFDTALGAGASGFCEDTLFGMQLAAAGFRLLGLPEPAVVHHPDITRLTRDHLLDQMARLGHSSAYVRHHWLHNATGRERWEAAWVGFKLAVRRVVQRPHRQVLPPPWELAYQFKVAECAALRRLVGQPRKYLRGPGTRAGQEAM